MNTVISRLLWARSSEAAPLGGSVWRSLMKLHSGRWLWLQSFGGSTWPRSRTAKLSPHVDVSKKPSSLDGCEQEASVSRHLGLFVGLLTQEPWPRRAGAWQQLQCPLWPCLGSHVSSLLPRSVGRTGHPVTTQKGVTQGRNSRRWGNWGPLQRLINTVRNLRAILDLSSSQTHCLIRSCWFTSQICLRSLCFSLHGHIANQVYHSTLLGS